MIVKELIAKLGLEMDGAAFAKAEGALAGLRNGFAAFGAAAVSAFALAAVGIAKSTAEAADHIKKLAQKTGVDSIALQEFAYAAELANVSTETLAQGMAHLAKTGVKDVQGEMLRLAEQFQSMPNDGDRVRLAMEKFGRSGKELIPLLADGREEMAKLAKEAHELGLVFEEDDQRAAGKFNDELTRLQKTFTGFRNRIGLMLIRPLSKAVTVFREWVMAMDKAHPGALEATFKVLGATMAIVGVLALAAGAKMAAAWLAAAWPIALAAGALLLVGLVLEDIYQSMTGGKSVVGSFSEYVKREFGSWEGFFFSILKWLGTLLDDLWDGLKKGFSAAADFILGVLNDLDRAARKLLMDAIESARKVATLLSPGNLLGKAAIVGAEMFGGGASPAASVGAGVNNPKAPFVNAPQFRADITVNALPGMSPKDVAEQVKFASDVWWDGKMREAAAGIE